MKNTNKKGFTIVELVIVIAVIAILAAVLIPTFASIIKKANQSADIQAVRQMNTLLAAEDATGKPANLSEAINALRESNIDMEDYKPLSKDTYFYWVKEINRVLYVDANNAIISPEEYKDFTYDIKDGWYSLSGEVVEDDSWKESITNNTISVNSGAAFVSVMKAYFNNAEVVDGVTSIKLTADIDLKGAAANFGAVSSTVTIDGDLGENKTATIYGMRSEVAVEKSNNNDMQDMSNYGYGLIGKLASGANVTISNVTISDAVIDDPTSTLTVGHAAVLAGRVDSGATLNISNITIENCLVRAEKKAAVLVGYLQDGGKLNISGKIDVKDCTVLGGREVAALIAFVQRSSGLVVASGATVTATNVTVEADETYGWTYSDTLTFNNNTHTFADEAKGYATKGSSIKLGVTTKHYWDTVDGLTLEQHFGLNDTNQITPKLNNHVAKNFS